MAKGRDIKNKSKDLRKYADDINRYLDDNVDFPDDLINEFNLHLEVLNKIIKQAIDHNVKIHLKSYSF